jgi:hypothetical protein
MRPVRLGLATGRTDEAVPEATREEVVCACEKDALALVLDAE